MNKREFLNFLAVGGLAAPAMLTGCEWEKAGPGQSVYDRVMASGVIRCGYTPYSVGLAKDPLTGELSGIYKDILEQVARKLGLAVRYVEEIGWGEQIAGLNAGRFDVIGSPVSVTGPRSRAADYTMPLYYSPVWVWIDGAHNNFDHKDVRRLLNDPDIEISTMDSEQTDAMADDYFPDARKVSLPQNSDFSQLMMNVLSGKADLTFAEPLTVQEFKDKNPKTAGTLRRIAGDRPLTLVPNILLIKRGEFEFKSMMNNALNELFLNGAVDRAIDRHEIYPDSYVRAGAR